jgi:hypothetical protein
VELYLHSPNTPSRRGAQLKHGDNFTFTFQLLLRTELRSSMKLRASRSGFTHSHTQQKFYIFNLFHINTGSIGTLFSL